MTRRTAPWRHVSPEESPAVVFGWGWGVGVFATVTSVPMNASPDERLPPVHRINLEVRFDGALRLQERTRVPAIPFIPSVRPTVASRPSRRSNRVPMNARLERIAPLQCPPREEPECRPKPSFDCAREDASPKRTADLPVRRILHRELSARTLGFCKRPLQVVRSSRRTHALWTGNAGRRRNHALAKLIQQVFVAQPPNRFKIRCARKSREQLVAG
jgi:hypothetical protein